MRVAALIALFFGFAVQPLLDTEYMGHVVIGIFGGTIALVCGVVSARRDPPNRGVGYVLAGLGACLAVWCAVMIPSAYRQQQKYDNAKRRWAVERVAREAAATAETTAAKERAREAGLAPSMSDDEILHKLGYGSDTFTGHHGEATDGFTVTYTNNTTSIAISRSYSGLAVRRFRPTDQQQEWVLPNDQSK